MRPPPPNQFAGYGVCVSTYYLDGALNLKKRPPPDGILRPDLQKIQNYQNITASSLGTKIVKMNKLGYHGSASFATFASKYEN